MSATEENDRAIYQYLLDRGTITASKDSVRNHPHLKGVSNSHVVKALQSMKSRGYVKEQSSRRNYQWYLTSEGIRFLNDHPQVPSQMKPELHSPLKRRYKSNDIIVNNTSNFKSFLVRCQAILDDLHYNELTIKAMGKATSRALDLAIKLNENNFNTFSIKSRPFIVTTLLKDPVVGANKDRFDPDNDDNFQPIQQPAIEIVVRKNQIEIDMLNNARKKG